MKVASIHPGFIEVDPSQVTVNHLARTVFGGWEAHGTVTLGPNASYEARVAYQNDSGAWQTEGTVRREAPPQAIMNQIIDLLLSAAG